MSMELHQTGVEANQQDAMNEADDLLVEKVWHDLDEQLPREQVGRVVAEIAHGYQNAKVKTFLPILIHREALEQLQRWLETRSLVDGRLPDNQQRHAVNHS
ncbi:MAG: hypothetical protein H6667_19505 [Ardenticatenaceae bacterium]|nr:hypothetical protein [Ardenticatenaceae bacterium]